jgi:O-antigen ligase
MFSDDVQCVYFFLPLLFLKNEIQLKRLLYFLIFISLIFPFGQLLMVGSQDYEILLKGQGTLRLGYGESAVFLAFAVIAFFTWERKMIAAILPAAGIVMLAHRSAFIGIVVSLVSQSILKGKKLKTNIFLGLIGILVVGVLFIVQETTSIKVFDKGIERAEQTFESTGTTLARMSSISQAFDVLVEHPIFGVGYGDLYKFEGQTGSALAFNVLHFHNFVLQAMAQTGLVGTTLFLWIIWYVLSCALRLSRMPGKKETGTFLFACILFFTIYGTMNTTFNTSGFLFWFLAGTVYWYFNEAKVVQRKA